jgi:hypothetical protein
VAAVELWRASAIRHVISKLVCVLHCLGLIVIYQRSKASKCSIYFNFYFKLLCQILLRCVACDTPAASGCSPKSEEGQRRSPHARSLAVQTPARLQYPATRRTTVLNMARLSALGYAATLVHEIVKRVS